MAKDMSPLTYFYQIGPALYLIHTATMPGFSESIEGLINGMQRLPPSQSKAYYTGWGDISYSNHE